MDFSKNIIEMIGKLNTPNKHFRLIENLESAVLSISNNIAEGKGRHSKKEFKQYLCISRGSLFEVVSQQNFFEKMNWISNDMLIQLENEAEEIGKTLNGLINSIKTN